MKKFFKKWWHALLGLYLFIYMPCFSYLETTVTTDYNLIHCSLDDRIPFCEYFIIPYYFWFLFVALACVFFFFRSQGETVRMGGLLILGMSTALIIYFVYPNGLGDFRPHEFARDNYCVRLVKFLYDSDTSTNVFPSLHVYNTLAVIIAVYESKCITKHHTGIKIAVSIIGFVICLSTVFLKQHSVLDVIASFILVAIYYPIFYKTKFFKKL